MIREILRWILHGMQQHYPTFRLFVWLDQCGISRRIHFWVVDAEDKKYRAKTSQEILRSQEFYQNNRDRVTNLMSILADEESRMVWEGVINYRTKRIPIAKGLYSERDQYFVKDIVQIQENEVFVDAGAFIGDTIQEFLNRAKKINCRIIAFEPDEANYKILKKFYGNKENVILVKQGVSDKKEMLMFEQMGTGSRSTADRSKATAAIHVINMDAVPECQDATWIKMDIEGAELSALRGAKEIIRRNHPKLTICIYHSDEDMIRIAEYIHELVPEYKLYIRCHTRYGAETVLYAVV